MLCDKPFNKGGMAFGCGQCHPCRFNKRREWSSRIVLESQKHVEKCFLTLTYDDAFLPADGSLQPRDIQLFLKRFRKAIAPTRIRFFFVGEYGDENFRPHYHAAIFGFQCAGKVQTPSHGRRCFCPACSLVRDIWGKGNVDLDELNDTTASYICGYVVKKMTKNDDPRLEGKHPEFARMSLRPGIGADAMDDVAEQLFSKHGERFVMASGDVPPALMIGGRQRPLGRYLRQKLRDKIGLTQGFRDDHKEKQYAILRDVFYRSQDSAEAKATFEAHLKSKIPLTAEEREQRRLNFESRRKIFDRGVKKL